MQRQIFEESKMSKMQLYNYSDFYIYYHRKIACHVSLFYKLFIIINQSKKLKLDKYKNKNSCVSNYILTFHQRNGTWLSRKPHSMLTVNNYS